MTFKPSSESEIQLGEAIKIQLANLFNDMGWNSQINYQGNTPSGESWFADVYLEKGTAKVAVILEWVNFDDEEFYFHNEDNSQNRIHLYNKLTASKVRGLWLGQYDEYTSGDFRCDQSYKIPYFYFGSDDHSNNGVKNNSAINIYGFMGGDEDSWVEIPLDGFVHGLFIEKTVAWSFMKGSEITMLPVMKERDCWKCHKPTVCIQHVNYYNCFENKIYRIDQLKITELPERHLNLINDVEYRKFRGIGEIKSRFSRTVGGSYISNGCQHCNSLQGDFFLSRFSHDEQELSFGSDDVINITIESNEVEFGHWFYAHEVLVEELD